MEPQPELKGDEEYGQWHWGVCSWTASKPMCPTGNLEFPADHGPYPDALIEQKDGKWYWLITG